MDGIVCFSLSHKIRQGNVQLSDHGDEHHQLVVGRSDCVRHSDSAGPTVPVAGSKGFCLLFISIFAHFVLFNCLSKKNIFLQ